MKNAVRNTTVILILMFFASCETETANLVNPPQSSDTDVPCVQFVPIIANQHDTIGEVAIFSGSGGIAIQVNSINANVSTLHIKFSEVMLTGNIAPGQFPIHIDNPLFPYYRYFTKPCKPATVKRYRCSIGKK